MGFFKKIFGKTEDIPDAVFFESILKRPEKDNSYPIVCPYCYESYKHDHIVFRSHNYDQTPVQDEELRKYQAKIRKGADSPILKLPVLMPYAQPDLFARIDRDQQTGIIMSVQEESGHETREKLCPRCHNVLPINIGKIPTYIISFLGNTAVGKTLYLTRLCSSINRLLGEIGITALPLSDNAREYSTLYQKLINPDDDEILKATQLIVQEPIVYQLTNGDDQANLILYDFPGEVTNDNQSGQEFISFKGRYLNNSDGLIICKDISTFYRLHPYIDEQHIGEAHQIDPGQVQQLMINYMINDRKYKKPVAIVYTKMDLINQAQIREDFSIPEDSIIFHNQNFCVPEQQGRGPRQIRCDLFFTQRQQLLALLKQIDHENDIKSIAQRIDNDKMNIFAVSASGTPVVGNDFRRLFAPAVNIQMPIIWFLMQMGLVSGQLYGRGQRSMYLNASDL